ncbi:hypothetical protein ACOSQ2_009067 [Xanthoceras sorbifolium]
MAAENQKEHLDTFLVEDREERMMRSLKRKKRQSPIKRRIIPHKRGGQKAEIKRLQKEKPHSSAIVELLRSPSDHTPPLTRKTPIVKVAGSIPHSSPFTNITPLLAFTNLTVGVTLAGTTPVSQTSCGSRAFCLCRL